VNAPPVDGLGSRRLELFIQNKQALPMEALIDNTQRVIEAAQKKPELSGVLPIHLQYLMMISLIAPSQGTEHSGQRHFQYHADPWCQLTSTSTLTDDYIESTPKQKEQCAPILTTFRACMRSLDGNLVQLSTVVQMERITHPPVVTHYNVTRRSKSKELQRRATVQDKQQKRWKQLPTTRI